LLHRQDYKPQGDAWGIPAGKVNNGETPEEFILKELKEKTEILLDKKQLEYFKKVYVRYSEYDFAYYIFHANLPAKRCFTPEETFKISLIPDLGGYIGLFSRG